MLRIKIGTNMNRKQIVVDENKTLREVLEENEINYTSSTVYVDGVSVEIGQFDKTIKDLNIGDGAYILTAQKTQNA